MEGRNVLILRGGRKVFPRAGGKMFQWGGGETSHIGGRNVSHRGQNVLQEAKRVKLGKSSRRRGRIVLKMCAKRLGGRNVYGVKCPGADLPWWPRRDYDYEKP